MTWWWFAAAGYQTILQPGSAVKMAFGSVPFVLFYLSCVFFLPKHTYFLVHLLEGRVIIPFGYGYTRKKDYAHAEIAFSGIPGNVLSDTPLMSRPAWCRPYPKGWYEPGITGDVFMEQSIKGFAWPKSSQWDDNISLHVVPIWISLPSSSPSSSSSSTTYSRWCFQPMS